MSVAVVVLAIVELVAWFTESVGSVPVRPCVELLGVGVPHADKPKANISINMMVMCS